MSFPHALGHSLAGWKHWRKMGGTDPDGSTIYVSYNPNHVVARLAEMDVEIAKGEAVCAAFHEALDGAERDLARLKQQRDAMAARAAEDGVTPAPPAPPGPMWEQAEE